MPTANKWPAEFYESGEAMPEAADVERRYGGADFLERQIARGREIMKQQKSIEPVLKYFVETGYRAINKVLRGQTLRKRDADKAREEMAKLDAVLLSEFCKRERPLTAYRGITQEFTEQLEKAFANDGLFSDPGYVIASTVERQTQYLMQIELPAGTPCMSLHKFLANEVLLPHGSRFKVSAYLDQPQQKVRVVAHWLGLTS